MNSAPALAITCLGLAVATGAQTPTSRPATPEKNPHHIEMDALSRTTLDRWEAMEYHLGRAGVKTISFTVKVATKSMLGDADATGKYTFDGKKGTLKWDNAGLGNMLATRGWSQQTFDRMFIADSHRRELANTELEAVKKGDATIIKVKGETKGGYKSFRYDKNGVAKSFTLLVKDPAIGEMDAVVALEYKKIGGKHVREGWSIDLDMPMGTFHGVVEIKNTKIGKYRVYDSVQEHQTMGEQPIGDTTLTFSDYKINGGISKPVKTPATTEPTRPPKEKPDKKLGKKLEKSGARGGTAKDGPPNA